jgi:hypothetical protein
MATSIPAVPSANTVNLLLGKLTDNDPDYRFMSLNDLLQVSQRYEIFVSRIRSLTSASGSEHWKAGLSTP